MDRLVTNSQMKTFRRCAREHLFAYVLGRRPVEQAEALRFGSLVHRALAAWWLAQEARLDAAIEAMRQHAADEYDAVRVGVLMQGYDLMWDTEPYEVISVESRFQAPLLNPATGAASRTFELAGVLDVLVRDTRDGRTKLIEHKTSSEDIGQGSDYWKRLVIDPQISTYFAGCKAAGHDVTECVYDVIGKPGLRPGKATPLEARKHTKDGRLYAAQREHDETPDEFRERLSAHVAENPQRYYQRGVVVRLEAEEADAAHDAWDTARLIREAELANRWTRNPDACVRFGRTCSYFPVCTGEATIDDDTRYRTVANVHEELIPEGA